MPFVASLATLALCAAYIYASTLDLNHTLLALIRALPALTLAAILFWHRRQEYFGEKSHASGYSQQRKYFHFVGIGLIFMGAGDALIQMEDHPVYKTKLYFLAGMIVQMIGHIMFMLRLSFRSNELKCQGSNKLNMAFTTFMAIVFLSQVLPKIGNDNLMKVFVILSTFIIGRHFYYSLTLAAQEEKYYFSLLFDVARFPKQDQDGPMAKFIKLNAFLFKGDIVGVKYGVKYYVVGASLISISSMITAYTRFASVSTATSAAQLSEEDRTVYIYTVYFPALVFIALSGLQDQACLSCVTRVIYNNMNLKEGKKPLVTAAA